MSKQSVRSRGLSRKTQLVINLMLTIGSLCASLIVAELVLRSNNPFGTGRPYEYRIPHPVLGWVLKPGATYSFTMPETTVQVAYNSLGWRDVEHALEKPDDVFRILVLGDSFMEATSVELSHAFHSRVETIAREAGHNVEVINLGVAGYGTLQEYLVFRDIGQSYEPDLVLLAFYTGNDLLNNSSELGAIVRPGEPRPFLELGGPEEWTITPVDYETAQATYDAYQAELESRRNSLIEQVLVFKLIRAGIDSVSLPDFFPNQPSSTEAIQHERSEMATLGVNYCDEPAEFTRAWETTERILARLKHDVNAIDSHLVVFIVPSLEEVSFSYMEEVKTHAAYPEKLCLEDAPAHQRLSLLLEKLDITQVPLLPDFRRLMAEDGIELYRYSEGAHWNEAGHNLAAERVVDQLVGQGLLPVPAE